MAGRDDVTVRMRLQNAKKFQSDANRSGKAISGMGRHVKKTGGAAKVASNALRGLGRAAVTGAGAFAALATVVGVKSVRAFDQQRKITRQTAQIIKTTGGAAKVTAGQVAALSGTLAMKTGVDDDVIQGGANMLLTFKKIRDEQGKGNDMFTQSTKAAVDLSVGMTALGKNMSVAGAATMLGKAMNDPIKGMNAMSRAGISFTQVEKDKITALVEGGNTLKAQQTIMGAVMEQFGGQGERLALPLDKLRMVFGELQEAIGGKLNPTIDKVAKKLTAFTLGMIAGTGAGGGFVNKLQAAGRAFMSIARGAQSAVGWIQKHKRAVTDLLITLGVAGGAYAVYSGTVRVVVAVTKAWNIAQRLLNGTMKANPIGIVVTVLALLAVAVAAAYRKFPLFRKAVDAAWKAIKTVTVAVVGAVKAEFDSFVATVKTGLDILTKVKDAIKWIFSNKGKGDVGVGAGGMGSITPGKMGGMVTMARGGMIGGSGRGDKMPALLEPGEFVMRRQVVNDLGPGFMASLNRGNAPAAAAGRGRETVVHTAIQLDGREVARSVSRHVGDRAARR